MQLRPSLLDLRGNPMPRIKASSGYEAAATGGRLSTWQPSSESVNSLLFRDASVLRSRSRDMLRQNAWAFNAVDSLVSNMIGTGIKPQSTHPDEAIRTQINKLFLAWCAESDADGIQGFYGQQALAARSMMEAGEVFVRLRARLPDDGLIVPLQLQLLESEHVPFTLNSSVEGQNYICAGVEKNPFGQRVAYHMYREHPGEMILYSGTAGQTFRIPARDVIHLYRPLRPGQLRGEPWLTQAMVRLYELDQYEDAESVRKKAAALISGFLTRPAPEYEENPTRKSRQYADWKPGTILVMEPGEEMQFSAPADVGGNYEVYMRNQLRAAAMAAGITYEQMTGDLTGVNYSSLRFGLLEFRRRMEQWQRNIMIHQFCRPIWARWMDQAVLSGALIVKNYLENRREYQDAKWVPQGWGWMDPLKDFAAIIAAVRAGFMSRDEAISRLGGDAETVDREIAIANQRADALGIITDSDPRRTARSGADVDHDKQLYGNNNDDDK